MDEALYCDGGVIGRNPSLHGGVWAYQHVRGDTPISQQVSLWLPVSEEPVTNNQTELLAILRGLQSLPEDWIGIVYSDSDVSLGRVFRGWKFTNIPLWMYTELGQEMARLKNWTQIQHVLLDGHPTREQLRIGIGKRGHPVSKFQVWCDTKCQELAHKYLEGIIYADQKV